MPQKKHKPEEIVAKLRQVDVLLSQGRPVAEAIRSISVTAFTYYRWRKEFGGLKSDQVKRMKELDTRKNPPNVFATGASFALTMVFVPDRSDPGRLLGVSADFGRIHPMAARRSWKIRRSIL